MPQDEVPATTGAIHQFGQRIGESTGTDIMDGPDRILGAQGTTTINDFLRPTLHLRVAALH